jgi:dTDP-4-amino-4,6-dideoxygalactose transaminase
MADTAERANRLAIEGGRPVREEPLPWELPGVHWIGDEEAELVGRVIRARSPFRYYGPDLQHMVDTLEAEWRQRFGVPHALGVNSGGQALLIALAAFGVGPGDEVLVPGYMWVSCLSAVVRLGAIPRLVDIDDTFCMDPDDAAAKINTRTKAILYVNMSGAPGHTDRIARLARDKGIYLLEDCAQAAGASLHGTPVGTFGDIGIFSFQLNKNLTSGDGGLLMCRDEHLYKRCFAIHDLGYARNAAGRLDPSAEDYQLWGVGARMSELSGAMVLAQFRKLDAITGAMRTAKWAIREQLQGIDGLVFRDIPDPAGDSGPFMVTLYPDRERRDRFVDALRAEGIKGPEGSLACIKMSDWGMHWYFNNPSLLKKRSLSADGFPWSHPANAFAQEISYERGLLPGCDTRNERGALLTIASCLTERDIDDIVTAFRKVARVVLA